MYGCRSCDAEHKLSEEERFRLQERKESNLLLFDALCALLWRGVL